ncbi:hypothetical protein [Marinobacterium aestuariivivens]|uniref:Uncharacterized protein n=1 Tax=Marinobacterium aestuariivivens TaxID=1698799 RepID=A0ABW1ZXP8_9GAMM
MGFIDTGAASASAARRESREQASGFDRVLAEQIAQAARQSAKEAEKAMPDKPAASGDTQSAREQLLELLGMSPAERIRFVMLKERGLTEETLRQLPAEERARIEAEIEAEIKRQLGGTAASAGGDVLADKST